jgi:hypothetical protein
MSSRRSNQSNQKNQTKIKNQKPKLGQELIIDSEDTYKDLENVFYIHPSHLNMLKSLSSNQFNSVSIKNTNVDDLNAYNLINLYGKVQVGTNIEIIIYQPVLVLQMYDAKQIEANALYAGFSDIKINEITYVDDKTQRKMETLSVSFVKPERKIPNSEENKNNDINESGKNSQMGSSKKGTRNSKRK